MEAERLRDQRATNAHRCRPPSPGGPTNATLTLSTRWKGRFGDDLGSARRRLLLPQIGRRNVEGGGHG